MIHQTQVHAGHTTRQLNNNSRVFDLQQQIQHKISFINQYFNLENTQLVLIGHSIGAYINLKVNKKCPEFPIVRILNLFPTIQDIYPGLPSGAKIFMNPGLRQFIGSVIYCMPQSMKHYLLGMAKHEPEFDESSAAVVEKLLSYDTIQNILFMAYTEAYTVKKLEHDLLESNQEKLVFLFSEADKYTPLNLHYHKLRETFPNIKAFVTEDPKTAHAFVMGYSDPVSKKVVMYIQDLLDAHI